MDGTAHKSKIWLISMVLFTLAKLFCGESQIDMQMAVGLLNKQPWTQSGIDTVNCYFRINCKRIRVLRRPLASNLSVENRIICGYDQLQLVIYVVARSEWSLLVHHNWGNHAKTWGKIRRTGCQAQSRPLILFILLPIFRVKLPNSKHIVLVPKCSV